MTSRARGARSPRSRHDVILLIVTSFATELATATVTDSRCVAVKPWNSFEIKI